MDHSLEDRVEGSTNDIEAPLSEANQTTLLSSSETQGEMTEKEIVTDENQCSLEDASSYSSSSDFTLLCEQAPQPRININSSNRRGPCCVCGVNEAGYSCPACGKSTCSATCARLHKTEENCPGLPNPAVPVSLKDFSDRQLQRDVNFLEDCRRVLGNIERHSGASLSNYSSPTAEVCSSLHSSATQCFETRSRNEKMLRMVRNTALHRAICCQITSPGMRRHDTNVSYVNKDRSILWYCEFRFYAPASEKSLGEVKNCIPEACFVWRVRDVHEQYRLGDVLGYLWTGQTPILPSSDEAGSIRDRQVRPRLESNHSSAEPSDHASGLAIDAKYEQSFKDYTKKFSVEELSILHKALRLPTSQRYIPLSLDLTVNEALKEVSFVTEFPVFEVAIRESNIFLPLLITEEEKSSLRALHIKELEKMQKAHYSTQRKK